MLFIMDGNSELKSLKRMPPGFKNTWNFVGTPCNSIVLFVIVIIIAYQCLKKFVGSKNAALEKCPKSLHFSNRTFFC